MDNLARPGRFWRQGHRESGGDRWVNSTLTAWLEANDLAQFKALLHANEVDLRTLEVLTESDLKELGVPFGPRKRMLNAIAELKRHSPAPQVAVDLPPRAARTGERRQLTVAFCDLVGSTALSAELDPEELHALISAYRDTCSEVVLRYGGHVAQYLGDGLMVYFGWPQAHEDAAERAVRSALEMVQAVKAIRAQRTLAVRIGLATGSVMVGEVAPDGNGEARLAVGETPNLAARLQAQAGPDEVVIAPTTRRLVAHAFCLTDLGARPLKGIPQPVHLWRVDEARRIIGRFAAAHGEAELPQLVGRDQERLLLGQCWSQATGGNGQVVLISGEPGIGKSRLVQALCEHITEPHTALHFQCSPYHVNSPLHPFIEQLEFTAGFARNDAPEQRLKKLEATLATAGVLAPGAAPLFAALLSLPTDHYPPLHLSPLRQKEETLAALVGYLETSARRAPVFMVVEDIHWIDPTSQELLELLVPRIRCAPVMLALTHRPEYTPPWLGQPGVTTLALSRLSPQHGARIVETLTRGRTLPPDVLAEILARTDGVPLFVEELTRSLLESGQLREEGDRYRLEGPVVGLAIPASLRDLLMARLDRLGPFKEFAQIGACIGREFSYELLARISGLRPDLLERSLDTLVDSGLVTCRHAPPAALYTFKHALIQDAAYDSLLKSRRGELHTRIAQVLATDFADRVAQAPEWLAHHLTQAGQLAEAVPLWRQAGILAVGRVALNEAVAHFQKGLALIGQLPSSRDRDSLELSIREPLNAAWTGLRGWAAPEVELNAAAILRLAGSQGNARSLLLAVWWVWTSTITQGRIADSSTWVERLLHEGGAAGDLDLRMIGHATAMVQRFLAGQLLEARTQTGRALALYDPQHAERWIQLTGHDMRTFVEVYACQLLWMLGFPDQARRLSDEAHAHAQAQGHAFNLVWAITFSAYVFAYRREPERFLERVDEADRLARDQGLAFIHEVSIPQAQGVARLQQKQPREAIGLLRLGIERWTRTGGNVRVPFLKSVLAQAELLDARPNAALHLIEECLEQIERPPGQERLWLAEVLRIKGLILMELGRQQEAETTLRTAIDCARRQEAKSWELRAATTLATLLAQQGRRDAARDLLTPIYHWFTEGADTPDLIDARALLEQLRA
jgi:class 3 adenylate cyclase/tetratricopeptide (TPR) repeat protein